MVARRSIDDTRIAVSPEADHDDAADGADDAERRRFLVSSALAGGGLALGVPVAACTAFSTAGVRTQMVGSPTPPQKSPLGTSTASTTGTSRLG